MTQVMEVPVMLIVTAILTILFDVIFGYSPQTDLETIAIILIVVSISAIITFRLFKIGKTNARRNY